MQTTSPRVEPRIPLGERLKQQLWLKALAGGGQLPTPTIERMNAIKELAATWVEESDV